MAAAGSCSAIAAVGNGVATEVEKIANCLHTFPLTLFHVIPKLWLPHVERSGCVSWPYDVTYQ